MLFICKGVDEDKDEAFRFYLKSAEQGNMKSQFAVGKIKKDHNKALKWYKISADQGYFGALKAFKKILLKQLS